MSSEQSKHNHFMQLAIHEAEKAARQNEVPVGAVLLNESDEVIHADYNQPIRFNDPSAHAEMLVLRKSAQKIQNYRLLNTSLYVTVEPCIMCMGAIIHARIKTVIFGTPDSKWGAAGSLYNFSTNDRLNHHPEVIGGILQDECRALMQNFFKKRRLAKA